MKRALGLALIIIFFSGCASTNLTSVKDTEFRNASYGKILIISSFTDLMFRKNIEYRLAYYLQKKVEVVAGIDFLPPTRTYSEAEIDAAIIKNNIDAILVASLKDFWESQYALPESTVSTGSASVVGNVLTYSVQETKYGGVVSKPRVTFECRLFDAQSGKCAWLASTLTKGNAFAGFSTLADSLAFSVAAKMWKDGVLRSLK